MRRLVPALAVTVLIAGACGDRFETDAGPNPDAVVHLRGPAVGTTIQGDAVTLRVAASGVQIVKADGDTSGRTAHYHVFIDRPPVAPGEVIPVAPDVVHTAEAPIKLTGLTNGHHQIHVVLGDGIHQRLGRSVVHTSVHIEGSSAQKAEPEPSHDAGGDTSHDTGATTTVAPAEHDTGATTTVAPPAH
jgi:hypothetical protein